MSRSTPSPTRVSWTLACVALLAACGTPTSVGTLCGPDDPPGTDCSRPSTPLNPSGLLVLELSQQGLPDPRSVQYHFVMVDLNSRDTAGNSYIQADAIRAESHYPPGRYTIEYLGLEPPGDVACTTDRPRREFQLLANGTTRVDFVFLCSAR
ncbi:MAG TPA: hypothetical protein VD707_08020 [Gemmatimonadales bacterium]|nr:hypothetical protein [Gemmatimonadales bacterium]